MTEDLQLPNDGSGEDGKSPLAQTQSSPVLTAHGSVEVGRSQDGVVVADGI